MCYHRHRNSKWPSERFIVRQVSDLKSKKERYILVTERIVASIIVAFILFAICAITYEDIHYMGYNYPYDYFDPYNYAAGTLDEFYVTAFTCIGIFLLSLLFIWKLFSMRWRLIAAGAIVMLIIGGTVFGTRQKNTPESALESALEIYEVGERTEEVNLIVYEPFRENTLAKGLDVESSLRLQNNLPRLDGATALYPLYAAFARATYPMAEYGVYDEDSGILCSKTSGAFNNLLDGTADLIFLMGVSEEQREQAHELGLELKLTPIGKEAFIFFVNSRNSMSNLTVESIVGIYSGQIKNWEELGGSDREIFAYQRPESSGSQIMLREIMGDVPIVEIPEKDVFYEMMGMYATVAYKNHENSLGYSFLYYIRDMIAEDKIKFLSINDVSPTAANIASGAYPFTHDFYAITVVREPETEMEAEQIRNTEKLIDWILSPQGQSLVESTGYVPLPQ